MNLTLGLSGAVSPWRHLRAIGSLPLMNAIVIPAAIEITTRTMGVARLFSMNLPPAVNLAVGVGLAGAGAGVVAYAIRLFVRRGDGTLAPWDPPRNLVIAGAYRRCRNPMKLGLFMTLLGEAVLLDSLPLLLWFACFTTVNIIYIRLSEEPALLKRFGRRYAEYCRHVPRWMPQGRAWDPGDDRGERGR